MGLMKLLAMRAGYHAKRIVMPSRTSADPTASAVCASCGLREHGQPDHLSETCPRCGAWRIHAENDHADHRQ